MGPGPLPAAARTTATALPRPGLPPTLPPPVRGLVRRAETAAGTESSGRGGGGASAAPGGAGGRARSGGPGPCPRRELRRGLPCRPLPPHRGAGTPLGPARALRGNWLPQASRAHTGPGPLGRYGQRDFPLGAVPGRGS